MENYLYTSIATAPTSAQIHVDVAASAMANKDIDGCTWHEDVAELTVFFNSALIAADKTILDGIVTDNS